MFSLLQGNYVSGSIYNSHTHDFTDSGWGTVTVTFDNDTAISVSGGGGSSESSLTFVQGTVYTVTVGDGGAGAPSGAPGFAGSDGVDSSVAAF